MPSLAEVGLDRSRERLILDVGCGAGNMTHHLRRYGTVLGVDSFIRPLTVAAGRGYPVAQARAESLAAASGRFSLVAALDVVEHCDDDLGVLRECWRVLRPGGLVALTVPAFSWLWSENDVVNGHRRRYSPGQLSQTMSRAGFQTVRVTCLNLAVLPLAATLILLRNRQKRSLGLAAPSTDDGAYQVEMQPTHPLVNAVLTAIGSAEAALVRRVSLPLGTGILAVGQKPAGAPGQAQR
jgi:SAM-dependent methyltransferase